MSTLSVIIPSRVETYLQKTIDDLLIKAHEPIEVVVVLDGYWPKEYNWDDPRIVVVHQGTADHNPGMRSAINRGMAAARGEYVMKVDEHCMFDEGFDVKLKADCEDNWVVIPRRYRLDAENWRIIEDGRPPIDYMYLSTNSGALKGWKWDERQQERQDILIDDTMSFQGSCYFMKKSYWEGTIGPLDDTNYGPFSQEAQEIGNKTWLSGGRLVVNKKTWYAHWYRGKAGRGFSNAQQRQFVEDGKRGQEHSLDFWLKNRWDKRVHDFDWLIQKFNPPSKIETETDE